MLSFTKRKGRHICSRIRLLWSHCMQSINAKNTFRDFWYGAPSTLDIFLGIVVLNKNGLSVSSPTLNTPGADVMHSNHCSMLFCPPQSKTKPIILQQHWPHQLEQCVSVHILFSGICVVTMTQWTFEMEKSARILHDNSISFIAF